MKFSSTFAATLAVSVANAVPASLARRQEGVQGFDISSYQETVDFPGAHKAGARFVMIKATEGTDYVDKVFNAHYTGATDADLIRGGYHFALPDASDATTQVKHFIKNGGGWSDDDITLPGMLDIETNPYGGKCYGLGAEAMVNWITEFAESYKKDTKRYPLIYTSPSWWQECTGDSSALADKCPLVMASWGESPSPAPGGWETHTFWQYSDSYEFGGDGQVFNGDEAGLKKIASG